MQANRLFPVLTTVASILLVQGCSKPVSEKLSAVSADVETVASAPVAQPRTLSPDGASVFFVTPTDGDVVAGPVAVEFGIAEMSVVKAGVIQASTGHHHLLIDTDIPDLAMPVPADENHRHFGDASTTAELSLQPGRHTLRLLFADHAHIPHDPPVMSDLITVSVE